MADYSWFGKRGSGSVTSELPSGVCAARGPRVALKIEVQDDAVGSIALIDQRCSELAVRLKMLITIWRVERRHGREGQLPVPLSWFLLWLAARARPAPITELRSAGFADEVLAHALTAGVARRISSDAHDARWNG